MIISKSVGNRIEILRFIMIVGVVYLHVPLYIPIEQTGTGMFDLFKAFFQNAFFRASVPVLTFISGYLLFSLKLDQFPVKLWKKKAMTLLVPFFIFNFAILAVAYMAQSKMGMKMSTDLIGANLKIWLDAGLGLTSSPINYPLNFLRDMFALMIIAPLMGIVLRHTPVVGLLLIIVIFMNNLDGYFVLRDSMAIQFYIGGFAAIMNVNMQALDKFAKPLLAIFVMICVAIIYFKIANRTWLVLASPLFIWPSSALVVNTQVGNWILKYSKYSFFVFIAHAPLLALSWVMYQKVDMYVPYAVYWIVTPMVVVSALVAAYKLLSRFFPTLFSYAIGCRSAKKDKTLNVNNGVTTTAM